MFGVGTTELLLLIGILFLLFGATRVPQIARDLGRSIYELRNGFKDDGMD